MHPKDKVRNGDLVMPVVDWGTALSHAATIASALCVIVAGLEIFGE
jgi:hypothetical protein